MEEQTQPTREEQIAAAELAVYAATDVVTTAEANVPSKEDLKAAADAAKDAATNLKAAKEYRASLAEDADTTEADESVSGWEAEAERTKAASDALKESAKTAREAVKTAKANLREAKKALTAAKKVTKPKIERVEQNGVKLPLPGSKCGEAWAIFDEASAAKGSPALLSEGVALAEEKNAKGATLNLGNVRAEYGQWRKFHGIPAQGRAKKEKPEAAPAEAAEAAPAEAAE